MEKKDTPPENDRSIRPTLDVNGIWGGYTGEGAKTVIPVRPMQKSPCAWFPIKTGKRSGQLFENHFQAIAQKV